MSLKNHLIPVSTPETRQRDIPVILAAGRTRNNRFVNSGTRLKPFDYITNAQMINRVVNDHYDVSINESVVHNVRAQSD